MDVGALRHRVKSDSATGKNPAQKIKVYNVEAQVSAYVHIVQHVLRKQTPIVAGWVQCEGYEATVKTIWRAVLLQTGLLEGNNKAR